MKRTQQGFGAIVAIVVLVLLATLAAAIVVIGSGQQLGNAQDVLSARAWQAAKAGNEWGLFQALRNNSCQAASTLDLSAATGMRVAVSCTSRQYNEGESAPGTPQTVTVFQITAIACSVANCPAADASVAAPGYVERRRVVTATSAPSN